MVQLFFGIVMLVLALACASTSISGTGSGGDTSTTSGTGSGGGTTLSKVSGPIDQFGSVVVGGIYFNTDDLTPTIEGRAGNLSELELGMWVTLQGNINTNTLSGQATSLTFEAHQAGTISAFNNGGNSFILNGTTINLDATTHYSANLTLPLKVNDRIQLSGQYLASGNFYATHISEHRLPADRHRLPEELRPHLVPSDFQGLQIEIDQMLSDELWRSGNLVFDFKQAEDTIGGNARPPLLGEKMAVRGQLLPSGNFQVLSWITRDDREGNTKIAGTIQSLSPLGSAPRVELNNIFYAIQPYTIFRDESMAKQARFGFRELRVGDSIELKLSKDGKVLGLKKRGP